MGIDLTGPMAKVFDAVRRVKNPDTPTLRLERYVEGTGYQEILTILSGWRVEEVAGDFADDRTIGIRITARDELTTDLMMKQLAAVCFGGLRYECTVHKPPLGNPAIWRLAATPTGT